jgi:hypothetical protein
MMKNRGQGASRAKVAHLNKVAMKNVTMSSLASSLLTLLLSILAHYNTFSNPKKKKKQTTKENQKKATMNFEGLIHLKKKVMMEKKAMMTIFEARCSYPLHMRNNKEELQDNTQQQSLHL